MQMPTQPIILDSLVAAIKTKGNFAPTTFNSSKLISYYRQNHNIDISSNFTPTGLTSQLMTFLTSLSAAIYSSMQTYYNGLKVPVVKVTTSVATSPRPTPVQQISLSVSPAFLIQSQPLNKIYDNFMANNPFPNTPYPLLLVKAINFSVFLHVLKYTIGWSWSDILKAPSAGKSAWYMSPSGNPIPGLWSESNLLPPPVSPTWTKGNRLENGNSTDELNSSSLTNLAILVLSFELKKYNYTNPSPYLQLFIEGVMEGIVRSWNLFKKHTSVQKGRGIGLMPGPSGNMSSAFVIKPEVINALV